MQNSLLQETKDALAEAEFERSRWCTILRHTDISDIPMLNVCREALAAWHKVCEIMETRLSLLNSNSNNIH